MQNKPINEEAIGDQIIDTIVLMYEKAQQQQPQEEPHVWLGNVWLGRAGAKHDVDIHNSNMLKVALYETYLCSCVKPPLGARALGLYFLFKEQSAIIEQCPKFAEEFNDLINPVIAARDKGTLDELYKKYNPRMADQSKVKYDA